MIRTFHLSLNMNDQQSFPAVLIPDPAVLIPDPAVQNPNPAVQNPGSSSPEPRSSSPEPRSSSPEPLPSSGTSSDESRYLPPENFPDPLKFKDTQKDLDEMNASIEDFDLGEALSQTITRPNFLISKYPSGLCACTLKDICSAFK